MTLPALAPDALVSRSSSLAELESDDSIILLALDSSTCTPFELTGGGIAIWLHLEDEPREVRDLVAALSADASAAVADVDLATREYLAQLVSLELVIVVTPP